MFFLHPLRDTQLQFFELVQAVRLLLPEDADVLVDDVVEGVITDTKGGGVGDVFVLGLVVVGVFLHNSPKIRSNRLIISLLRGLLVVLQQRGGDQQADLLHRGLDIEFVERPGEDTDPFRSARFHRGGVRGDGVDGGGDGEDVSIGPFSEVVCSKELLELLLCGGLAGLEL